MSFMILRSLLKLTETSFFLPYNMGEEILMTTVKHRTVSGLNMGIIVTTLDIL